MIVADLIRFVLTHIPLIAFGAALILAYRSQGPAAERYLSWLLLLAVGLDGLWAGLFHVFAPETAARFIGWQVSPFQFEVGIADIALGITAVLAFRSSLGFKSAVVCYASLFYIGVAIGHVREIVTAGNFAPGNGGVLLVLTLIRPVALVGLLIAARRSAARRGSAEA